MNKKITILLITTLLAQVVVLAYVILASQKKDLVYVDSGRLLNEYKGMIEARKAYQLKSRVWQSNLDTLSNEIEQMIFLHEKSMGGMNAKEIASSESDIQKKQQELINYQKAVKSQAAEADAQMTQSVLSDVNEFLKTYGENKNYSIILAATNAGNIVYANKDLDITEEVVLEINKTFVAND